MELLANKLPDRFRERFGDVFIVGVNTGGEYFAIYQISGTDQKEKEQVSVAVNASFEGVIGSADLGVKINSLTENSTSHLEVKAFNFQLGGSDPSTDLTPEQMMAKARSFAQSVRGDFSVPYSMLPASYNELKKPDDTANPIDIESQRQALADAWKIRNDLVALKNDVDYILLSEANNHNEFEPFNVPELTVARNQLAHEIDAITKGASKCMVDAKQCEFAEFDISAIRLPNRKLAVAPPVAAPPKLDSITEAAFLRFYPGILLKNTNDMPHTSRQVQSDLALGIAWAQSMAQATANAGGPIPPRIADSQSPIQRQMAEKLTKLKPNAAAFALGKFPDVTPDQEANLSGGLAEGMALRLAMEELGEDVSRITFR